MPTSRVPDEVCQQCGKAISRRAHVNIFEGRVVCTPCLGKLSEAGRKKEVAEHAERTTAEEPDIARARDQGVKISPGVTVAELGRLVAAHEAAGARARDVEYVRDWVYSVCRHTFCADWLKHSDAPFPAKLLSKAVKSLLASAEHVDQIYDQRRGDAGSNFERECEARGLEDDDCWENWFFFGPEGADEGSPIYAVTRALVEPQLGPHLPSRRADEAR